MAATNCHTGARAATHESKKPKTCCNFLVINGIRMDGDSGIISALHGSMAGTLYNKAILIIDDDVRMLHALEKVFTQEDANVTCVDLAVDAFKILAALPAKFSLLITDLRMPFVSGAKTVSVVHAVLPKMPIVVLTAFGDPQVKAECLREGATLFLEKPVDASHLLEVVTDILKGQTINRNEQYAARNEIQAPQIGKAELPNQSG